MFKRVTTLFALIAVLSLIFASVAFAQEPTEDFETVRSAIEEWLATGP